MTNDALFIEVLAHIEVEPATWMQGSYRCASGMCFAGWAAELSGYKWAAPADHPMSDYVIENGKKRPVWEVATELLTGEKYVGDEVDEELELFESANDLDDLYRLSARLMGTDEDELRERVAAALRVKVPTQLVRS
jgi:hypothetical protein